MTRRTSTRARLAAGAALTAAAIALTGCAVRGEPEELTPAEEVRILLEDATGVPAEELGYGSDYTVDVLGAYTCDMLDEVDRNGQLAAQRKFGPAAQAVAFSAAAAEASGGTLRIEPDDVYLLMQGIAGAYCSDLVYVSNSIFGEQ